MMRRLAIFLWALCLWPLAVHAHKASDSYLTLTVTGHNLQGHWDIALRDIDFALTLDADGDGAITWGEVRARREALSTWALDHLKLERGGPCALEVADLLVDHHTDGAYAVLDLRGFCPKTLGNLRVRYGLLFDLDSSHRGLLNMTFGDATQTAVFSPEAGTQILSAEAAPLLEQLRQYITEGVWHIWTGFDHLLFLFSLLLPAVLKREAGGWVPATSPAAVFKGVVILVTSFTLAHSITLSAAVLGWISLPSRWVESAVALSVVLAAANNLWPVIDRRLWLFAFVFGLVHGFGFATVLMDLQLPASALALSLVGFNLGVELGQLVCVAVFLPLAYLLRGTELYRKLLVPVGSVLTIGVATVWLAERAFNMRLISS